MYTHSRILICFGFLLICITRGSTFFLGWGNSDDSQPKAQPHAWPVTYYQQRYIQSPPPLAVSTVDTQAQNSVPIPAIPIQVPLQAQLSSSSNIHNVQLVPCLCPVSPDLEFDKEHNVYYKQK
ncbi:hypothetical protein QE152_g29414 [Popillia japonica]|uniref:Uncharacterized protein n=1 Tax=Popillia japonica TaxID=7064 RepID=A0AAW1JHT2_POPJA